MYVIAIDILLDPYITSCTINVVSSSTITTKTILYVLHENTGKQGSVGRSLTTRLLHHLMLLDVIATGY